MGKQEILSGHIYGLRFLINIQVKMSHRPLHIEFWNLNANIHFTFFSVFLDSRKREYCTDTNLSTLPTPTISFSERIRYWHSSKKNREPPSNMIGIWTQQSLNHGNYQIRVHKDLEQANNSLIKNLRTQWLPHISLI